MGRAQQKKGRDAEKELSRILNTFGIPARPGAALNFGTEPDLIGIDHIHPEVKRIERLNVSMAMRQAIKDSEKFGGLPVLFHRKNREEWFCTMRLIDWIELYQNALKGTNDNRRTEKL